MFKKDKKIKGVIMSEPILLLLVILCGFVGISVITHVLNRDAQ